MRPQRLLHLVARGGNAAEFPENTLPALRSAIELGARFIELDVQLSADGIPMVIRDHDLARVASIAASVFDLKAAELMYVEAHEPRRFRDRFRGTCIPKLTDALRMFEQRPEVTVFIVLGRASISHFGRDQAVSQVLQTFRTFRSRCVMVSTDLSAVFRAREMGDCQIGWTISAYDNHTRIKYEALQPQFLFCHRSLLPQSADLWRGPWRWVINEVSSLETALTLARRGADFIATADVRPMGEAMRAHAAGSAAPGRLTPLSTELAAAQGN
jgi:glycerophosphoryl diester phosphodiesterase